MTDNAKSPILSKNVSSSIGLEPPLRFPGFEGEWEEIILKQNCSFFSGGTPTSTKKEYYNGDIPFIRSGEIHSNTTELFISNLGLENSSAKMVQVGDILYALYGATSGEVDISKINGAINQAILCIRSEKIENVFLKNLLLKLKFHITSTYLQGGQGNLSAEIIKNLHSHIPSKTEQQKIADFLSLVDKLIEKQRQLVEVLKRYKRGALLKIFDGCETWTKYLAKDVGKISTGSSNTQDSVPNGMYPFFIRSASVSKSNKFVYDGEAVLTIGDGQIGKVFHYINGKFDCHQRVYMITKFTNISGRYFYHFFSTFFYNRAMKMSARNTVDSVRMEMIADMPIYVPGKQEELRIVCFLDGIDSQIQKQEQVLESMILYKNGLLQKMFI